MAGVEIRDLHPSSWATDVLNMEICPASTAAWLVCGAYTLWTGRNNRRHGRKVWEPGSTVRFIASMIEELASLKVSKKQEAPIRRARWQPPEQGWLKVNTDASFDPSFSGSTGVVIRDDDGVVQSGAARWLDDVPDALTAEALAAKEGMELAWEMGYDRVILETDCKTLKTLLEDRSGVRSMIGSICFDITELVKNFRNFRVVWVGREANTVAHHCACRVTATDRSCFWREEIPDWLTDLAATDCNSTMIY